MKEILSYRQIDIALREENVLKREQEANRVKEEYEVLELVLANFEGSFYHLFRGSRCYTDNCLA